MTKKHNPAPTITTSWEDITPEKATAFLEKNVTNRPLREATVKAYERDMLAGNWVSTHQGVAFNDREELIDGQHRLTAVVRSAVTVRMLVTRGLPAISGATHTMDAVDRGAGRSIADQLNVQHGFRNANRAVAAVTGIASMCLVVRHVRVTVSQVLKLLEIYGRHITEIGDAVDKARATKLLRRAQLIAALAFARAVEPHGSDRFLAGLVSGADLSDGSPILTLRNFLLSELSTHWSSSGSRQERTGMALLVLNSVRQFVAGEKAKKTVEGRAGFIHFAERQADSLTKIGAIFLSETVSLRLADYKSAKSPPVPVEPAIPDGVIRSAKDVKLTPAAEALISGTGKNRVDYMRSRIKSGAIDSAI